jgi:biotin carboxyl carrier protein
MKKYKVTVNDNTYEVEVEEVGGAPEVKSVQVAAPAPKPAPAPAPKPAPAPAPAPEKKASAPAPSGGSDDVIAPMPGTVLSVNVAEGDKVKKGQVLLIFEAMKMENEIVAPREGTVAKVLVSKGAALESGKPVITLS